MTARITFSVSLRSRSAPVGQWVIHWPQMVQSVRRIGRFPVVLTLVRFPVLTMSHTFMDCTLSQICTQRMHLIHFPPSRISGNVPSQSKGSTSDGKGTSMMFSSLASSCREQFWLRTQVAQR